MSQFDLFNDPEIPAGSEPAAPAIPDEMILCKPIQHRLDRLCQMVADGHLLDAHIEAKVIESETESPEIRERAGLLAAALWDARAWRDAWRVIEKQRRAA